MIKLMLFMGVKLLTPKVSYRKHFGKDGTVYGQRITIDFEILEKLNAAISSEIALDYPREKEYSDTSGYAQIYLTTIKPLKVLIKNYGTSASYIYGLRNTQTRFINLFLKLKLKDMNTYLVIKQTKPNHKVKDEWYIQGYYSKEYGWEEVSAYDNIKEAKDDLKAYRENQPEYPHRLRKRRIKIENQNNV